MAVPSFVALYLSITQLASSTAALISLSAALSLERGVLKDQTLVSDQLLHIRYMYRLCALPSFLGRVAIWKCMGKAESAN